MVDWTALHPELLQVILDLLPFPVHMAFRSVCRSWRALSPIPPPIPPFMLADRLEDDGRLILSAFNLAGEEMRPLDIIGTCCGSSYGWLALAEYPICVHLMNPVTRHLIPLPPFPSGVFAFDKLVASSDPADPSTGECVLMAFRRSWDSIAFSKPPYATWTEITYEGIVQDEILDAACYKGDFYVVSDQSLYLYDITDIEHPRVVGFDIAERGGGFVDGGFYLVVSGDDLLLVIAARDGTPKFEVFKISLVGDHAETEKVESFGERSVFLSGLRSFSVIAGEFPGCKRNCIYVAEAILVDGTLFKIYNMEDKSLTLVKHPGASPDGYNWDACVWFIPTLFPDGRFDNV